LYLERNSSSSNTFSHRLTVKKVFDAQTKQKTAPFPRKIATSKVRYKQHDLTRRHSPALPYELLIDVNSAAKPVVADLILPPLS
jgi:hypothetical protein